jgi:flagellar FliJ protein
MKKYQFKLEAVKKLRESKEQQTKLELAAILKDIKKTEDRIEELKEQIISGYQAQEKVLETPGKGEILRFFPNFVQAKKEDIKANENKLAAFKRKYLEKVAELGKARADVKVMESMKDKDFGRYKKEVGKKEAETIEDILNIRRLGESG